jgi:signal transduction histidine kinase
MIARGRTVGVLSADNRVSRAPIPAHTVDLLHTFAAQAAVAVENARLFQEIQEKSQQLELASKHKSQFLANMSHELRTPMNAVLGYTDLILDDIFGDVPPPIRETLERVKTNGHHLLALINDVLDLSKMEAGSSRSPSATTPWGRSSTPWSPRWSPSLPGRNSPSRRSSPRSAPGAR